MKHVKHPLEYHLSVDTEQTSQRVKLGDRLEAPREIDHSAYFRKRTDAEAAAAELCDDGFRTSISRHGFGAFALEARTESDVEPDTVDAFVERIYDVVERHGGIYDGWGGPVVLKARE
jgi:regulator of RNase E activity RraB